MESALYRPGIWRTMEESEQRSSIDIRGLPARFDSLKSAIRQVTRDVMSEHKVTTFAISISFIDDKQMSRMNMETLHREGATDVIAFDLSEEGLPFEKVGDVYISTDTAIDNSARFGVEPAEEILRLAVHGVLHVLGYDDGNASGRRKMSRIQENIIRRFSSGPVG
jgi:probable rRNA maturation factor